MTSSISSGGNVSSYLETHAAAFKEAKLKD